MSTPRVDLRTLTPEELSRIAELDRSEEVALAYEVVDGLLRKKTVNWRIPGWSPEGNAEHSLAHQRAFCLGHLEQGGVMIGAFREDRLIGTALVRPRFRGELALLAFFYVDRRARRQGVAGRLLEDAVAHARKSGARRMYVSAIPSASAVGFYRSQGFRLVAEPDPELFALEPQDIHMVLEL